MYATPAPFFTLSSRGFATFWPRVNTQPRRCSLAVPSPLSACTSTHVDALPGPSYHCKLTTLAVSETTVSSVSPFFHSPVGSGQFSGLSATPRLFHAGLHRRTALSSSVSRAASSVSKYPVLSPSGALSPPFPTKSAITLTVLPQATGPVSQEVRLPTPVWLSVLPCALFTRLPPPWLALCSAPRSLRYASSEQSTYTAPLRTSSPALASSYLPCSGRLPVWRNRTLFRDCDVTRLQVHHKGFPNRVLRYLACHFQTPEVIFRGGSSELPRSPFPLAIPLNLLQLFPGFASGALRVLDDASEEDHEGPYPTSITSAVACRG